MHISGKGPRVLTTGLTATALLLAGLTAAPAASAAEGRVVLEPGHIDAPKVFWEDGGFALKASAGEVHRLHDAVSWLRPNVYASSYFFGTEQYYAQHVGEEAPALDFLGEGTTWWAAPANCIRCGQIWQGFAADTGVPHTQFRDGAGLDAANADGTFWLDLVDVDGPGRVEVFAGSQSDSDKWGTVERLFSSQDEDLRTAALKPGTHTHISTLFSAPGDYTLTWRATARTADGKIVSSKVTAQDWRVGGARPDTAEQPPLAERYAAAPAGPTEGYAFSVAPVQDEKAGQFGIPQAAWSFTAPDGADGTALVFVDGYPMTEIPVKDGKGSFAQLPAVGEAEYQAVFLPEGKGARWSSAPVSYAPGGAKASTSSAADLPTPSPRHATPEYAPQDTDLPDDLSADVTLSPGRFDTTFGVDVELSDPRAAGRVRLDFFDPADDAFPWATFEGTLRDGRWQDQIEDVNTTKGLQARVTYLPHASMDNVHISTGVAAEKFDPKATTTATVRLASKAPGSDPAPIEDPTPADGEIETDPVTLDRGHVDLGPAIVGKDLDFVVGDDTALHHPTRVNRTTDSVTLKVNRSAFTRRTEGMDLSPYKGLGDIFYLLPQTQKSSLVWPGFSTEHLDRTRFPEGLDVELQTVSAPAGGKWWASVTSGLGKTAVIASHDAGVSRLDLPGPVHMHNNWVFSTPGRYVIRMRAVGEDASGTAVQTPWRDVTFQVEADPERTPDFADNKPGSYAYEPIRWMQLQGMSAGYSDGTFRKNRDISRGESLALIHRYLHPKQEPLTTPPFKDVPLTSPFAAAAAWAADAGVSTGYKDGTFRPGRDVSRGEFAAFLYRAAGGGSAPSGGSGFRDVSEKSPWRDAVAWMKKTGLTTGYADGTFRPDRQITRAEVAIMLHRLDQSRNG